jgi:hypothetical protein
MLTEEEVQSLSEQIEKLECSDRAAGDGLFGYVFLGEPREQASRYEPHLASCKYCQVARSLYRYKREAAQLWGKARNEGQGH